MIILFVHKKFFEIQLENFGKCHNRLWAMVIVFFALLLPYHNFAQIQTSLDPEIILIGDTASLKITVTFDARQKVILPQLGDSLNSYLEISHQKVDTLILGNNANYIQTITLTCFEPGDFLVNSLPIVMDGDTLLTKSFNLEVKDLEIQDADIQKMYPIKPIIPQEITWWEKNKKYLAYWVLGLILAAIILTILWMYIKAGRNKKKYVSKPLLPPYEEAMDNLHKLDKEKLLKEEKYYEYYTDLSFIVRRYFGRRFDFPAMALLSGDLPIVMNEKEILTSTEATQFSDFLKDSDLAKYARTVPSEEKHELYRKWIEEIIHRTRPILEDYIPEHLREEIESEKLRKLDKR